jgi:hypothetical protein
MTVLGPGLGGLPARRPDQLLAPPSSVVAPGAAAGVFRGRLVIISGTGVNTGLFVYAGTPSAGNPPVLSVVAPGTVKDPFGNTVSAILEVQGTAGQSIVLTLNGGAPELLFKTGSPDESALSAGIVAFRVNPGTASETLIFNMTGPTVTGQGDTVFIDLSSAAQNASANATGSLDYTNGTGGTIPALTWGSAGVVAIGNVLGVLPGTGTFATPATPETWHSFVFSSSIYTVPSGGETPAYRLTNDGLVELKGEVVFTSIGTGLSGSNVFTNAIASAAYLPVIRKLLPCVGLFGGSGTITASRTPVLQVNTNGSLQLLNVNSAAAAGTTVFFNFSGRYSLTNP